MEWEGMGSKKEEEEIKKQRNGKKEEKFIWRDVQERICLFKENGKEI